MISVAQLIEDFNVMWKEHWEYVWGAHEKGKVDCSGAFYYVFSVMHKLPMYNGSNRIARVYIAGELMPYKEAKKKGLVVAGMAAFKARKPSDSYYDLGSGYKQGGAYYNGDLNDYYHIGLIDTDTNYVLNAQSAKTGFVRSKITESWSHVALLKNVKYDGGEKPMEGKTMVVIRTADTSSKTNTVNVRKATSTTATIITALKFGTVVQAYETSGEWTKVTYGNVTGWMMSKFLREQDEPLNEKTITEEQMYNLQKAYEYIGEIIGK